MLPPVTANLNVGVKRRLMGMVKPKFDAYFLVTSRTQMTLPRSVPDPQGQPWFIYPDQTLILDLTFLWSIFADVYQIIGGHEALASFVHSDTYLEFQFHRIVEGHSAQKPDGEFWHFPRPGLGGRIPLQHAVNHCLEDVLRTLRNGLAHSLWLYTDLSALDYWNEIGWDTAHAPTAFNLQGRPQKNYTMYIADGRKFNPSAFWSTDDLRILVTPAHVLRYHLHGFLNFVLNGSKEDVFQA
jgi:hypothetical protein